MKKIISILLALAAFSFSYVKANNLQISNVSVPGTTTIQFDISWDNSWNIAGLSHDAVWVFVKAQVCGGATTPYNHADLSTVSADHSVTGGVLQVDAVTDGKGVFIRRSATGTAGNITTSTVTIRLATAYVIANTNFEVFGIEMVNIPSGSFSVGDGSTNNTTQSAKSFGSGSSTPRTITSEAAMAQDYLRNNKTGDGNVTAHTAIIAGFPKGFNSFYCMKYEISQQQYTAFLNIIDYNQQVGRLAVVPSSATGTLALTSAGNENRNSIEISTPGTAINPAVLGNDLNNNNVYDEAGDGGNIACNFLSWEDLKAYMDWAALRPMTELEYEKVCRGPLTPVLMEYPWGSTTINQAVTSAIINSGMPVEISLSAADGLSAHNGGASTVLGPFRVGFAATALTGRTGAGASYYGVMDMGGNLWEQCFTIGYYNGAIRTPTPNFSGTLGDGYLDMNGNADVPDWGAVNYSIVRGGGWEHTAQRVQTSDRFYANTTAENATRTRNAGGRGVR